jgi:hypothetical protein
MIRNSEYLTHRQGVFSKMRSRHFRSDVDTAFKVLYLQTYPYIGDGTTFGRRFRGTRESQGSI